MAPPAGVQSPANWGTEAFLHQHFGPCTRAIEITRRDFNFRYQSPEHWLDVFTTYYGPTLKAFQSLDADAARALRDEIRALIGQHNRAGDDSMVVPSTYLEVVITR